MRKLVLILLGVLVLSTLPNTAEAGCSSRRKITRVYVIRRNLSILPGIRWCALAHSGLILEMSDRRQCVLEYLGDGRSHLYDARPTNVRNCWFKSCKVMNMRDSEGRNYRWTRQKYGTAFPGRLGTVTPQAAQKRMQRLMGTRYNLLNNNCHLAQERLRRAWGMRVGDPYRPNISTLCTCVKRFPYLVPIHPLLAYLNMVKAACRQRG